MMQANKIANSDLLDILFDGRNKLYGAYTLRKNYNKRLTTSVGIVLSLCLVVFISTMASKPKPDVSQLKKIDDINLVDVKEKEQETVVPVTPPPPPLNQLRTEDFVTPLIAPDNEVTPEDLPPTQDDMQDAVISNYKQDGFEANNIVASAPPPEATGTGLAVELTPANESIDKIFTKVELPAEYEGGPNAWKRFLERNLRYPERAVENGTQGIVRVEFVVDKQGFISEIKALNNPGDGLAEEAARIIKQSRQWKPAEQNGEKVKYRHIQSITFRLE